MKKHPRLNCFDRFFKNFPLLSGEGRERDLFLLVGLFFLFTSLHAAVPSRITYQGRLSKSGVGAAGKHTITVQFITASGEKIPASQTFEVDVPVSGDFSLNIDNIPPDADWINGLPKMRVIVGGETLTPDQSFSATPYALVARNVENLDTSKVKLAGDDGGALLSSWQSPDDPTRINSKSILGPIEVTTNHGAEHGLLGKDKIPAGTLSPSQIIDTALVLTSSVTQTIQPTEPVVPLVVKGQKNTGPNSTNMFEVWDNAAIPSKQFHIQDFGTAFFKGNVGIGTETPMEALDVRGNVKVRDILALRATNWGYSSLYKVLLLGTTSGVGTISLGYDPSGNPYSGFTGDGREVLFRNGVQFVTPNSANTSFYLNQLVLKDGNVGVGTSLPSAKLEVSGGDLKVSGSVVASSIVTSSITLTGRYIDKTGNVMPVGTVLPFAGKVIPPGWLLCDGNTYSSATRPELDELRQVLGSTYGGDGTTTFTLPDLRGRTVIGDGQGSGLTNRNFAQSLGEENHRLTISEIPSHNHNFSRATYHAPSSIGLDNNDLYSTVNAAGFGSNVATKGIEFNGGGQPHNIMQPSLTLHYIIKY